MKKFIIFPIALAAMFSLTSFGQGTWMQKANFGGSARYGAVAFTIEGKGYIGTGASIDNGGKDWWEYDSETDTWTQKADLIDINGEGRTNAVAFAIDNYGYVGTGYSIDVLNDFWQYDPSLNQWTKKKKFPGDKRWHATGFSIGQKGYIGSGAAANSDRRDFYEYDPATDTWTQIADHPGQALVGATGFSIGDKGYVAFGSKNTAGVTSELWEYDPLSGLWTQKSSCPGSSRDWAVAFVIADKAYIGTGTVNYETTYYNDFWQYDPVTDSWAPGDSLPASARSQAVGFAIGDKGYVATGWAGVGYFFNDFWEFTPGCEVPGNPTTTNISSQSAKLKWDVVGGATKYRVQYREDASGAPWVSKMVNASKTAITINGLAANTAYKWKVRSICGDGQSLYSAAQTFTTLLRLSNEAGDLSMLAVYPNPMSSDATLSFSLAADANTTIQVFDLAGRKTELLDEILSAGEHRITLSRKQLDEGIFLVKFITGNQISVIKVIVQ